ncbi:acyl-CoA dehydrogenase, N-terminal domain protein [Mycolicibacterium hassiacum DSM 44199]|uniref:Acyl-CoA dehydrogenase, N-terminal domain protein n=1 Tax=Mycolicibacterium hassiacum (strain DSM 44199 / CIP 105218 / JCM 12690 / 3849) TaxID=1122247 RepID=K5B7A4_MYCHD|nr:acyl-CoA dehydrogenase family protein [Mycolicibacterium hassiacum]EKF21603.1 acyl-CoA dehydrogenase, N-terminal domain protein [Mycolicibacterium hassiacum DSM 44199]MDA4084305.1 acyl-CoA dehydrogenase [Mycolicibacterium hassiacum DSM 44199]VCT91314.1 (R)-benzylsuccinyl-CoA dehydrogenase [Mycolicibacterium hassiacum DSM 44199]
MSWDFSTEPEFEAKLDWIRTFVREEVEPLDALFPGYEYVPLNEERRRIVDPLKQRVREQGLWAPHLGPELGGQGFGAVKLTLINEILGRTAWGPIVFGTQAPDTGNAEILARFGTPEQKERYLQPLLNGDIFSCFSMTEPQGGADPRVFTTRAVRDGDDWVINGYKYFSSNATVASFFIVLAITDPDVPVHKGASMFLIPAGTPGLTIEANHHLYGAYPHDPGHALVHYDNVRVPADAMLGEPGQGFHVAQSRLAGGRLHHAMRCIGVAQKAIDMMAPRAKSRFTQGSSLADKQLVQQFIADSYTELMPFRLAVLHAAWLIDTQGEHAARAEIAACKILAAKVVQSITLRAMQVHGAMGLTKELPLAGMFMSGVALGLADGPTEAHKVNLARQLLKGYEAEDPLWPSEFYAHRLAAATERYGTEVAAP